MQIGCLKEIKAHEYRVGLIPSGVKSFVKHGHKVQVEKDAGLEAGFTNDEYEKAGAIIEKNKKKIFSNCELIIKVKEPLEPEYNLLKENQILFTYLHLAANRKLTIALMKKKIKAVAYETIETEDKHLPCLIPMSEIAGRLSVQEGAKYLEKTFGGRGILLGGVPGVSRGRVAILGGGVVGTNACKIATGMGADVTILDINPNRLAYLDDIFGSRITTLYATEANIEKILHESDVIIGAVLVTGSRTPQLVKREQLSLMKKGAVIVDVAIDQGGCFESSHPTTHDNPVYVLDGIVHYAVSNMPGAVALSSTMALTSTTLMYGLLIADYGLERGCLLSSALSKGVNIYNGKITYPHVAETFKMPYSQLLDLID